MVLFPNSTFLNNINYEKPLEYATLLMDETNQANSLSCVRYNCSYGQSVLEGETCVFVHCFLTAISFLQDINVDLGDTIPLTFFN